jgi:hypothetical protein
VFLIAAIDSQTFLPQNMYGAATGTLSQHERKCLRAWSKCEDNLQNTEIPLNALKQNRSPSIRPASLKVTAPSTFGPAISRSLYVRMESEEDKKKRIAEEREREDELTKIEKSKKESNEKGAEKEKGEGRGQEKEG